MAEVTGAVVVQSLTGEQLTAITFRNGLRAIVFRASDLELSYASDGPDRRYNVGPWTRWLA